MSKTEQETKFVDYAEAWYRTWCPYCGVDNWVCNGNEQDLSGLDVEAIKCRSCKQAYRLGVFDEIMEEITKGNYDTEDGREMREVSPKPQENKT